MLHKIKIKLNEDPFERIKSGEKTVEFRLFDEKRQRLCMKYILRKKKENMEF